MVAYYREVCKINVGGESIWRLKHICYCHLSGKWHHAWRSMNTDTRPPLNAKGLFEQTETMACLSETSLGRRIMARLSESVIRQSDCQRPTLLRLTLKAWTSDRGEAWTSVKPWMHATVHSSQLYSSVTVTLDLYVIQKTCDYTM